MKDLGLNAEQALVALIEEINKNLVLNLDQLIFALKSEIDKKYNIVVTDDSLPASKKNMASLNKEKAEFRKIYKAFKEFVGTKATEIEQIYDTARDRIANQVKLLEKGK